MVLTRNQAIHQERDDDEIQIVHPTYVPSPPQRDGTSTTTMNEITEEGLSQMNAAQTTTQPIRVSDTSTGPTSAEMAEAAIHPPQIQTQPNTSTANDATIATKNSTAIHQPTPEEEEEATTEAIHFPTIDIRVSSSSGMAEESSIRILISPELTCKEFSNCLAQISLNDDIRGAGTISGLYKESDHTFLPLSHILSDPKKYKHEKLCITLPPPPSKPKDTERSRLSRFKKALILGKFMSALPQYRSAIVAVILCILLSLFQRMDDQSMGILLDSPIDFFWIQVSRVLVLLTEYFWYVSELLVDTPLRDFYRYGPSPIGWEGVPLNRICSQITYYGDEEFWRNNSKDCEIIYNRKETGLFYIGRPLFYTFYAWTIFVLIRAFIKVRYHKVESPRNPDMEETFQAFTVLARQLRKATGGANTE